MAEACDIATPVAPSARARSRQGLVITLAFLLLAGGTLVIGAHGWRQGALFLVGGLIGMTLVHAGIGFTSAYRKLFTLGDASGVNAQILMLAAASVLFAPVLSAGFAFGHEVVGAVAPVGLRVAIGAFLFGMGMQLGCACGSGTLSSIGAGSLRMGITLAAFCAGGFWASLDAPFWAALPSWGAISLGEELGWGRAVFLQLAVLGALALALRHWGARIKGTQGSPQPASATARSSPWRGLWEGPWPLVWGALALAALNLATLLLAGHPWSVTWGFTLWAAKVAAAIGWEPSASAFWTGPFQRAALENSVFADVISVMNMGIVLGALGAAALAGRFSPTLRLPYPTLVAVIVGGLMMGYGARLAFGCNIGAFFSGVASFSLHGWLWIVCALAGTAIGVRLRGVCGLPNERRPGAVSPAPTAP
jgi:uncharacterized membrane protein YedE/YeeE